MAKMVDFILPLVQAVVEGKPVCPIPSAMPKEKCGAPRPALDKEDRRFDVIFTMGRDIALQPCLEDSTRRYIFQTYVSFKLCNFVGL